MSTDNALREALDRIKKWAYRNCNTEKDMAVALEGVRHELYALAAKSQETAPAAFGADARAYAHKAIDRVREMRKLDLERANDPAQQKERDYYLGRAHRCDDILFWIGEFESHLPAGQAAPATTGLSAEQLAQHWLSEMVCDHALKRDRAVCCCGFVTHWAASVGNAAILWAEHALLCQAAPASAPRTEMYLCEINHLVLHSDQPYIFRQHPNCYECNKYLGTKAPDAPTAGKGEWRTVIVGLPIIRRLLNGESVGLETFHISLIPDDVLFNARPARPSGMSAGEEGK